MSFFNRPVELCIHTPALHDIIAATAAVLNWVGREESGGNTVFNDGFLCSCGIDYSQTRRSVFVQGDSMFENQTENPSCSSCYRILPTFLGGGSVCFLSSEYLPGKLRTINTTEWCSSGMVVMLTFTWVSISSAEELTPQHDHKMTRCWCYTPETSCPSQRTNGVSGR